MGGFRPRKPSIARSNRSATSTMARRRSLWRVEIVCISGLALLAYRATLLPWRSSRRPSEPRRTSTTLGRRSAIAAPSHLVRPNFAPGGELVIPLRPRHHEAAGNRSGGPSKSPVGQPQCAIQSNSRAYSGHWLDARKNHVTGSLFRGLTPVKRCSSISRIPLIMQPT